MGNSKYNGQLAPEVRRSIKKASNYNPKGSNLPR